MFTGLVENTGTVLANTAYNSGRRLLIQASFESLEAGESISVNGVCLTLLADLSQGLAFDVSPETLSCTNLTMLLPGQSVNLERAMTGASRLGGHYVTGHVDYIQKIHRLEAVGDFVEIDIEGFNAEALSYLIPKGSITVDGVSLTINEVFKNTIRLLLVPHTVAATNLKDKKPDDWVNIEFDHLAKIVFHQLKINREQMSLSVS